MTRTLGINISPLKARHIILICIVLAALAFIVAPVVFSTTSSGPMLAMPIFLTRDGKKIPAEEIQSMRYRFSETRTSFDPINTEQMKDAKPFQTGFLVDAPFTTTRSWMFGRPSTTPEYRSLTLQLSLVDGETYTMCLPILSDTRLNSPVQLEISNAK